MALFLARASPRCSGAPSLSVRVSAPRAQSSVSFSRASIAKRSYAAEAKPAAESAAETAAKIRSYKELLVKRDQRNREIVSQIGPPVDSSKEAQEAQQWYWNAFSERKLPQVEQDIAKIEEFGTKNKEFGHFLARGSLPPQIVHVQGDTAPAGAKVFTGADGKPTAILPASKTTKDLLNEVTSSVRLSDVTVRFLQHLDSNGHLKDLRTILEKFRAKHTQRAQGTGTIEAVLTVAQAWSESEINKILNAFLERNPQYKGAQIKLQTKVDPSIMGGFKLKIADRFVDRSEKAEYEKAVKQQELQTTAFYQKLEEAAVWQAHVYWQGPYANDSEYLEAMEDKYGDDIIETVRSLSADKFEQEIKSGLNSKLVSNALKFAQPPASLDKKMSSMIYFKPKDLPRPTLDELVADWQKVRSLPSTLPRL